jgi:hypothetical protein
MADTLSATSDGFLRFHRRSPVCPLISPGFGVAPKQKHKGEPNGCGLRPTYSI